MFASWFVLGIDPLKLRRLGSIGYGHGGLERERFAQGHGARQPQGSTLGLLSLDRRDDAVSAESPAWCLTCRKRLIISMLWSPFVLVMEREFSPSSKAVCHSPAFPVIVTRLHLGGSHMRTWLQQGLSLGGC